MAYRANEHKSTKCTPNFMMFGREINCPFDIVVGKPPNTPKVESQIRSRVGRLIKQKKIFSTS